MPPLLLDTHALIWFVDGNPQMPLPVRAAIEDLKTRKYISIASLWEMAIKVSLGKMKLTYPIEEYWARYVDGNGYDILPVERAHLLRVATLPLHHRDPFDRLLAAQALTEDMPLITGDPAFAPYGVRLLWD